MACDPLLYQSFSSRARSESIYKYCQNSRISPVDSEIAPAITLRLMRHLLHNVLIAIQGSQIAGFCTAVLSMITSGKRVTPAGGMLVCYFLGIWSLLSPEIALYISSRVSASDTYYCGIAP